jgi:Zn-dependent M28 family amino/carboxypeptidase
MRSQWTARAGRLPTLPARIGGVAQPARPRPAAVVLDDEAHAAMSQLPAGTVVTITADVSEGEPGHSWNAVGRLTGADPQQAADVIVLSAHLDHVGARDVAPGEDGINNGADDDASGTIAVLELAEALARGPRPKRTVVFAAFGSEERGGFGAGYFVDRPVVPLKAIVADLQFEMLGRPDELVPPHTLWLTGYERSDLGAELAKQGARLVADPHPDQGFFTRSDNIRFARRGVVAHTVSSFGLHTDYHRPSDEIDTIDFAHMTDAIRSLVEPIRWFANSTFRPAWAPDGCPAPCGQ